MLILQAGITLSIHLAQHAHSENDKTWSNKTDLLGNRNMTSGSQVSSGNKRRVAIVFSLVLIACGSLFGILSFRISVSEFLQYSPYGRVLQLLAQDGEPLPDSLSALHEAGEKFDIVPHNIPPQPPRGVPDYRPIPNHEDPNSIYLVLISPEPPNLLCFNRLVIHTSQNLRHLNIEFVPRWTAAQMLREDDDKRSRFLADIQAQE